MKRLALFVIVAAFAMSTTNSANAADSYYGSGYVSHTSPSHRYVDYGHRPRHAYVGHAYAVPTHSYGVVPSRSVGHGSAVSIHGGSPYSAYGHSGYVRVSTPYFGLRIGH